APPEQYDMGMGHTDPRSDVYSFGATLYHAFTGRTPPTATQRMANPASFISPRRIRADISPRTEDAVLKGMEVAMNSRFQSAASMAEALGLAVHHRPTAPQQSTTGGTMIIPGARLDTHAPAEYPSAPMKPPRKRGIGLWLGIGGGALACLALAACIVIVALGGGGDATPTPVAQATATSTAISTPMPTLQPTNTPESVGVPTETPAPLQPTPIAGGNVLLEDSFDDPNSGWEEKEFDNGTVGYGDGYYYILSAGESLMNWGTAGQDFGDVIIDVDTIQVSAPTNNNNGYGVMCRVQENGDGYLLRISGDGYYSIYRILEGAFEALVSWTSSSVVRQGNATNHIRAVCEGDQLTLIVNGEQLAQTTDASFASGDVGMSATTYEVEATEIRFDDVRVVSAQEAALFSDDFSDPNSGWDVWETGTGDVVDYGNGVYRVYEMEGYWMWGASNHHFTDIVIDVDATQISAPANNNNGYGVFCRVQPNEWGDGYAVTISGDGFYSIQKISQGDWTELVEWTRSNVINQGNATNHIQVVCSGSRIALFVNDQFIDEVIDADYASGDVSLAATTYEDTATEIHFDNLVIRRANP
ncbi:MAG: hypothetical protein JXD18_01400, partial [Anaerolineae bacterium]|nr:hypothetical protein [Anaerolineae bacterium]